MPSSGHATVRPASAAEPIEASERAAKADVVVTDLPEEDPLELSTAKPASGASALVVMPPTTSPPDAAAGASAPPRRASNPPERKVTTLFDRRGSAPRASHSSIGERAASLRVRLSGVSLPLRSPSAMRAPGTQKKSRVRFPSVALVQHEIAVGTQAAARQHRARAQAAAGAVMDEENAGEIHEGSQPHAELLRELVGPDELVDPAALKCDRLLGAGTFGQVYECRLASGAAPRGRGALVEARGGRVAVKMLRSDAQIVESAYDSLTTDEVREASRELAILRALAHEHVIGYVGCGLFLDEHGHDQIAILLELAEHGSLASLLARKSVLRGPYACADALRWLEEISLGLRYLHGCAPAIVHRDLKPENVLLCGAARVAKICDFGLAAFARKRERAYRHVAALHAAGVRLDYPGAREADEELGEQQRPQQQQLSALSRAEACAASDYRLTGRTGSLKYMAPEVYLCEKQERSVDQYSFAILACEILQRRPAFANAYLTPLEIAAGAAADHQLRPRLPNRWPAALKALLQRCWHQSPGARPEFEEIAQQLGAWRQQPRHIRHSFLGAIAAGSSRGLLEIFGFVSALGTVD